MAQPRIQASKMSNALSVLGVLRVLGMRTIVMDTVVFVSELMGDCRGRGWMAPAFAGSRRSGTA